MIEIHIEGKPIAQPRPRFYKGRTIGSDRNHPIHWYKDLIRFECRKLIGQYAYDGPVVANLLFVMPRTQKDKYQHRVPHTKKPDIDNLIKGVLDALNGNAWTDDARVWSVFASKLIAAPNEGPHTLIKISEEQTDA